MNRRPDQFVRKPIAPPTEVHKQADKHEMDSEQVRDIENALSCVSRAKAGNMDEELFEELNVVGGNGHCFIEKNDMFVPNRGKFIPREEWDD